MFERLKRFFRRVRSDPGPDDPHRAAEPAPRPAIDWSTETWNPSGGHMYSLRKAKSLIDRLDSDDWNVSRRAMKELPEGYEDEFPGMDAHLDIGCAVEYVKRHADRNKGCRVPDPWRAGLWHLDQDLAARDTYFGEYGPGRRPDVPYSIEMKEINSHILHGSYMDVHLDWLGSGPVPEDVIKGRKRIDWMQRGRRIELFGFSYGLLDARAWYDGFFCERIAANALLLEALETGRWQELPDSLQGRYRALVEDIRSREEQPEVPLDEAREAYRRMMHERAMRRRAGRG